MFTFHTDAGHGWIEVDAQAMREAGLKPSDFSRYSYRAGASRFYLEEDCDAPKFIAAWQEKTGRHAQFSDRDHGLRAGIRQYSRIRD